MHESTLRRRLFICDPQEPLLAPMAPAEQAVRLAVFCHETGLAADQVASSIFGTIPAPVYREPLRRWPGVHPAALWHPLFWLPDHLARRFILDDEVTHSPETDEVWLTRLAIELTASGVYDEVEGTWVDALAWVGLDVDDPVDLARITSWQAGSPDELLDALDIRDLVPVDDTAWAVPLAWEAAEELRPVAWFIHATALLDDLTGLVADQDSLTASELGQAVRTVCSVAASSFEGLGSDVTGEFAALASNCEDLAALTATVIPQATSLLAGIRDAWEGHAGAMVTLGAQVSPGSAWDDEVQWEDSPPASKA